jgi:hypothetical protein
VEAEKLAVEQVAVLHRCTLCSRFVPVDSLHFITWPARKQVKAHTLMY